MVPWLSSMRTEHPRVGGEDADTLTLDANGAEAPPRLWGVFR